MAWRMWWGRNWNGTWSMRRHAGRDAIESRAIVGFVGGVLFVDGSVLAQKWIVQAIVFVGAPDQIRQRRH